MPHLIVIIQVVMIQHYSIVLNFELYFSELIFNFHSIAGKDLDVDSLLH